MPVPPADLLPAINLGLESPSVSLTFTKYQREGTTKGIIIFQTEKIPHEETFVGSSEQRREEGWREKGGGEEKLEERY